MTKRVLVPCADPFYDQAAALARKIDTRGRDLAARLGMTGHDGDATLCAIQVEAQRAGYTMVTITTNVYGFVVRDTMNDGAGVLFGGRSRPGTTQEEALAWAKTWHAEKPDLREVIAGHGFVL